MEEACVTNSLKADHECLVKCSGLYADVLYSEDDNKLLDTISGGDATLLEMLKEGEKSYPFE